MGLDIVPHIKTHEALGVKSQAVSDTRYVKKVGDTMTGPLNMDIAASTDGHLLRDTSGNKKWSTQHGTNTVKQDFYSPEPTNQFSNSGFETGNPPTGWTETETTWWLAGGISAANCIAAYQPKGAADLATSYVNLNAPGTNNAAPLTGAPTFNAALGWVGVAGCTGLRVSTWVTPAPSNIMSVVVRTTGTPTYVPITDMSVAYRFTIFSRAANNHKYYINPGESMDIATGVNGVFALTSQSGADEEVGYMNGVQDATNWGGGLVISSGLYPVVGPLTTVTWSIAAVAWYSVQLTPAQVLAVSTAMSQL
jgi:hypothetical protein